MRLNETQFSMSSQYLIPLNSKALPLQFEWQIAILQDTNVVQDGSLGGKIIVKH